MVAISKFSTTPGRAWSFWSTTVPVMLPLVDAEADPTRAASMLIRMSPSDYAFCVRTSIQRRITAYDLRD